MADSGSPMAWNGASIRCANAGSAIAPRPERADRDAELGAGDHQRDVVHGPQRRPGPPARRGHRLDHGTAGGDDGELAAHKERVAEQQR